MAHKVLPNLALNLSDFSNYYSPQLPTLQPSGLFALSEGCRSLRNFALYLISIRLNPSPQDFTHLSFSHWGLPYHPIQNFNLQLLACPLGSLFLVQFFFPYRIYDLLEYCISISTYLSSTYLSHLVSLSLLKYKLQIRFFFPPPL